MKINNIENTINSIDGATALKLDEQIEIQPTSQSHQETSLDQMKEEDTNLSQENVSNGISIENASYLENNIDTETKSISDEYTPELFSDEKKLSDNDGSTDVNEEIETQKLFDQSSPDEEEFEIPAFLRKQKF